MHNSATSRQRAVSAREGSLLAGWWSGEEAQRRGGNTYQEEGVRDEGCEGDGHVRSSSGEGIPSSDFMGGAAMSARAARGDGIRDRDRATGGMVRLDGEAGDQLGRVLGLSSSTGLFSSKQQQQQQQQQQRTAARQGRGAGAAHCSGGIPCRSDRGTGRGRAVLPRVIEALIPVLLVSVIASPGMAQLPDPVWKWDVGLTSALNGEVEAVTEIAMPHYACTRTPSVPICPGCQQFKGTDCTNAASGPSCDNCNRLCEGFSFGFGSFPGQCLPRLQTMEGEKSALGTWFEHKVVLPGPNGTTIDSSIGPNEAGAPSGVYKFHASVRWGYLDIYGLQDLTACRDTVGCSATYVDPRWGSAKFETQGEVLEEVRSIELEGTFQQIYTAMKNMSFIPVPLFNSLRVRHQLLAPTSTRVQPFFTVEYRGPAFTSKIIELAHPANFTQLIHVIAKNDAPVVTDPQDGYKRGCITQPPCDTQYSIIETSGPNYHFGQYWQWEGRSEPLVFRGIQVSDVDVDELCLFDDQKPALYISSPLEAFYCGRLDFNARALIGVITLNTRDDLSFYDTSKSSVGFTADSKFLQAAVRAVKYQIDMPEIIDSGLSLVATVNTQYTGATEEFVYIVVSDQGLSGASGIAQSARDKNGDVGLRINVTIAAVNNAPLVFTPTDFTVVEDEPILITGLSMFDIDSEERSTSTLAFEDWLGKRWNQRYLNRVRMTLELKGFSNDKGRGLLYLSPDARDLFIVGNMDETFVSIESIFPSHSTCSFWSHIKKPGVYVCSAAAIPSLQGKGCKIDTDCNVIASGSWAPGTTNDTIVFSTVDPARDAEIANMVPGILRLDIVAGRGSGSFGTIVSRTMRNGSLTEVESVTLSRDTQLPLVPNATSNWTITKTVGGGKCIYQGENLDELCVIESDPVVLAEQQQNCANGPCACRVRDTCGSDGKVLLYLNRSKPDIQTYIDELTLMFSKESRVCGGLPISRDPYPKNFSLARKCENNATCQDDIFPKCIPGQTCMCCNNVSVPCRVNSDCERLAANLIDDEIDTSAAPGTPWCGCTGGIEPPSAIVEEGGPRCCANLSAPCQDHADCTQYLNGSYCGCLPGYPICGPFEYPLNKSAPHQFGYGRPCVYRGVLQTRFDADLQLDIVTMYGSNSCEAPMFSYEGTRNGKIFNQLAFQQNQFEAGTMEGFGSTRIEFYAEQFFVNLALSGLVYLTANPMFPKYNRLYRIPESDRDPTTFKLEDDDFDNLHITANDMGNSGGGVRSPQQVSASFPIVVTAVNNPPVINGPQNVTVQEDVPFSILHDPAAGLEGIYITDPDQTNFGFNSPRIKTEGRTEISLGFLVNLTVQHGCLFLNEDFLRNGPDFAGRPGARMDLESCSLVRGFDLDPPGCTIRLKDYGQPQKGLHAMECTDQRCTNKIFNPCFSDSTIDQQPHCFGRICTKFLAIEGRFPDVNSALSNVTYLSEPDFNTFYGIQETLTISIDDNGLTGDALDTPSYRASIEIPVFVTPVNDVPAIGRLVEATCVNIFDDGQISLNEPQPDSRLFAINPATDFIDVNEDTAFTLLPDRLWISDVDSEEAEILNKHILQCAGECGSVRPAPDGCCRVDVCPDLCNKVVFAAIGALPSQILVEFIVTNGMLSFYPPPTRSLLSGIEFMTNLTLTDIKSAGEIRPCPDQLECMRNQTRLWIRGQVKVIQQALQWGFLTYQGAQYWHGSDTLNIWVSDDGYSDLTYQNVLSAQTSIPITVVPINSAPTIHFPGGEGCNCNTASGVCECQSIPPLIYTKGQHCANDWMKFGVTDAWPEGRGLDCKLLNESKLPNDKTQYAGFPQLTQPIAFDDIDMNDTPNGNMTVEITIGRINAGSFTIRTIMKTVSYYQYIDDDEILHFRMQGKMRDINLQMQELYYNADDGYSGPAPFVVSVSDNNNYGICTPKESNGRYQCNRAICKNYLAPSTMNEHFVCGSPGINLDSMTKFVGPGAISCRDIQATGPIVTRVEGSWSGPFSCLGCGYYIQSTRQVNGTSEDNPSIPGLTRAIIDTVVGGASACEFANCSACNRAAPISAGPIGDGCGWCPAFCGGVGKCMIGKFSPIFETCPTHADGRGYRNCEIPDQGIALILGVSLPLGLGFIFAVYTFVLWIRRRHGTLGVYLKKKKFDIQYSGRKFNLLPPEGASYKQFFYLVVLYLITGVMLSGVTETQGGPFFFQQEVYLDASTSIRLDLDNCNVRFLPTRNFDYPTNQINAIKLRFAFMDHPQVQLVSDTCRPDATFFVNNTRNPSLRYTNYYCTVQILVPDSFVMPRIIINAVGSNLTTVRSGPMDADTRNFGLDFGANEFVMSGDTINARIANISAKHLKYDVLHGSLLATEIKSTLFGTFNSLDADMVVTTEAATSARFYQKDNLVCLSGGTVHVEDSCSRVCDYVPLEGRTSSANNTEGDFRDIYRVYRRRLEANSTSGQARGGGLGGRRQACDLVEGNPRYVPGCVTSSCTIDESALCTCKPTCDMVPAEELDFNGVKGQAGTCDSEGKCCRTICGGYSLADLHPHPNTVQCGLCQDQTKCSLPTCGTWTPGKLDQQWWFTSQRGQISISVTDPKTNPPQVHSYKGAQPSSTLSVKPDLTVAEKVQINDIFHPGGAKGPVQPWFWLRVAGPGAPSRSLGTFVWLRSARYMVLPDYLLNVVSFGQLNPTKTSGTVNLFPGYCPTFVDETGTQMRARIIEIYSLLTNILEYYPETEPAHQFEAGALVIWFPGSGGGKPSRFVLDSKTNELSLSAIEQFTGEGENTYNIFLISIIVPVLLASILVGAGGLYFNRYLTKHREVALIQENAMLNVVMQLKVKDMTELERINFETIPQDKIWEMRARTNLWYVLENIVVDPSAAKTVYQEFFTVVGHLAIISAPVLYPYNVASMWKEAYLEYVCESRLDQGVCYSEPENVSLGVFVAVTIFAVASAFDLSCHYLKVPFRFPLTILRIAYYVLFALFCWFTYSLLFISGIWIFLGALQVPRRLGVYALTPVLIVGVVLKYFAKLARFNSRVRRKVEEKLKNSTARMAQKNFSPKVFKILLDKNVDNTLRAQGLSFSRIVVNCIALTLVLIVIYAYIFIGFQAFTDNSSRDAAILNAAIVISVAAGILMIVQEGNDSEWANDRTEYLADNVMDVMQKIVTAIEIQVKMANRLMRHALPNTYLDDEFEEDEEPVRVEDQVAQVLIDKNKKGENGYLYDVVDDK